MKNRILKGWTGVRLLYAIIGTGLIITAIVYHDGFMGILGAYLAAMGIFSFGCAAGNCYTGSCQSPRAPEQTRSATRSVGKYKRMYKRAHCCSRCNI